MRPQQVRPSSTCAPTRSGRQGPTPLSQDGGTGDWQRPGRERPLAPGRDRRRPGRSAARRGQRPRPGQARSGSPRPGVPRPGMARPGMPRPGLSRPGPGAPWCSPQPGGTASQSCAAACSPPDDRPPRTARARAARPGRARRPLRRTSSIRRLNVTLLAIAFAISLVLGRLVQLQGVDGSHYRYLSQQLRHQTQYVPAVRGQIVSSDGTVLAHDRSGPTRCTPTRR